MTSDALPNFVNLKIKALNLPY